MVRNSNGNFPTGMFWNFAGLALLTISFGASWSIVRSNYFELEAAQYKLKTINALVKAQKASDQVAVSVEKQPIPKVKRIEIKRLTQQSSSTIDAALAEVDRDVERLVE